MSHVFKLSLIEPSYEGYTMDFDGRIYDKSGHELIVYVQRPGEFYVTMTVADGRGLVRSFAVDKIHLMESAKAHPQWKKVFPEKRTYATDIENFKLESKKEKIMSTQKPEGLFNLVNTSTHLTGYYIDKDGYVYSNKLKNKPYVRLLGDSKNHSTVFHEITRYKLNGRTYTAAELLRKAKQHANWSSTMATKKEIKDIVIIPRKGEHIIASVVDGKLVIGSNPKVHVEAGALQTEMERLAKVSPGTKFIALTVTLTCVAGEVKWS